MNCFVVDENVTKVAYGNDSPQADDKCRLRAIEELERLKNEGIVVIDDSDEVLSRYRGQISKDGQPSTARIFVQHLMESYNPEHVIRIGLVTNENGEYETFPKDDDLKKFDRNDRIFVALALANPQGAAIINAVDSDYSHHKKSLKKHRVTVIELCPHCLK